MKGFDGLALTGAVEKDSEAHGGADPGVCTYCPLQGGISVHIAPVSRGTVSAKCDRAWLDSLENHASCKSILPYIVFFFVSFKS